MGRVRVRVLRLRFTIAPLPAALRTRQLGSGGRRGGRRERLVQHGLHLWRTTLYGHGSRRPVRRTAPHGRGTGTGVPAVYWRAYVRKHAAGRYAHPPPTSGAAAALCGSMRLSTQARTTALTSAVRSVCTLSAGSASCILTAGMQTCFG